MYADGLFPRFSGVAEAKSTEYAVNVRSPSPRFTFEHYTLLALLPPVHPGTLVEQVWFNRPDP